MKTEDIISKYNFNYAAPDETHLVLADYLEEQGKEHTANFIRMCVDRGKKAICYIGEIEGDYQLGCWVVAKIPYKGYYACYGTNVINSIEAKRLHRLILSEYSDGYSKEYNEVDERVLAYAIASGVAIPNDKLMQHLGLPSKAEMMCDNNQYRDMKHE